MAHGEVNALCRLQKIEIERLTAMVNGESPLPNPDHIVASRMEIKHQTQEHTRLKKRIATASQHLERLIISPTFISGRTLVEKAVVALNPTAAEIRGGQ